MKNKLYSILLFLLLALTLTGCKGQTLTQTSPSTTVQDEVNTYTFTDSMNHTVTVPYEPKNVAVLFASYAEIWSLAGGNVPITIEDSISRGFANSDSIIVGSSSGHDINLEVLLAAKPDFVILTADYTTHVELAETLREQGIPTALFQIDTFDQYLTALKIFTDLCKNIDAYETYGSKISTDIQDIISKVPETETQPTVLLLRATSTKATAKSADNFVGLMLKELGTDNIADHTKILLEELSMEAILEANPNYIFVTTMGSDVEAVVSYMNSLIDEDPAWQSLSAIQNKNYYILPKDLFLYKPNARWNESYGYLAELLYPDTYTE